MTSPNRKFGRLDLTVGLLCTAALLGLLEVSRHVDAEGLNVVAAIAFAILHFAGLAYGRHRARVADAAHAAVVTLQKDELRATNEDLATTVDLIRETLASVDELFLLFGPDGTCFVTPSARTGEALDLTPEGAHLTDILRLDDGARAQVTDWWDMLFAERVAFETLVELGPAICVVPATAAAPARTYRIKYFPMRQADRLENVIVTLLDVTASLEARAARAAAEARAKFILAVAQHGPTFEAFVREVRLTCARAATLDPDALRHQLHTHKGTASIFYIEPVVAAIHAAELRLGTGAEHPAGLPSDFSAGILDALASTLASERHILTQLRVFDGHDLIASRALLTAARLHFGTEPRALLLHDEVITRLRARDLTQTLLGFADHVSTLGERLGKMARLDLAPDSEFCALLTERYAPVGRALIHLFNNAVDHGLETPTERARAGKLAEGRVRAGLYRVVIENRAYLQIRVSDDGRGIAANVVDRIFDLGVTTKTIATDVSGLGVGLNGLRAMTLDLGGQLTVRSEVGRGTLFTLSLPAPESEVWFSKVDLAWSVAAA